MRKHEEFTQDESCLHRATHDEMLFILLGRDIAAPFAIRAWCAERIRLGKNTPGDAQILEALQCAEVMEKERAESAAKSP